jgi:hypothetical protein
LYLFLTLFRNNYLNSTVNSKHYIILFTILFFCLCCSATNAQSVSLESKTSPDLDFTFNSIEKYVNGITIPHALELNINTIGAEWDLYIGATSVTPGAFNVVNSYSNTGISPPPVSIIQARVYNSSNTPTSGSGFFPLTDIASPVYIIGSNANDATVNCGDANPTGTNAPGSYLSDPECYKLKVDLKLTPGLIYRPGLYTLRIDFILIEDL